jgi:hypothetical protein
MVEYCDEGNVNSTQLRNASCSYNNTIFFTTKFKSPVLGITCTTGVTSLGIFIFAVYVIARAFTLPNKSFFMLILGLIVLGTASGTYAVILYCLIYKQLS